MWSQTLTRYDRFARYVIVRVIYLPFILIGLVSLGLYANFLIPWLVAFSVILSKGKNPFEFVGFLMAAGAVLFVARRFWMELCCILDGGDWSS